MEHSLVEVLDEIQLARRELIMCQADLLNCEKRVEECTNAATKALGRTSEAQLRLDGLELKLRATLAGDTTTVITVPPPRMAEPEEIGRAG